MGVTGYGYYVLQGKQIEREEVTIRVCQPSELLDRSAAASLDVSLASDSRTATGDPLPDRPTVPRSSRLADLPSPT